MRQISLFLLTVVALTGCQGRSIKEDNPVLGPAPPRLSMANEEKTETEAGHKFGEEDRVVMPAGYAPEMELDENLSGNQVVATVNGQPIFADEVLAGYGPKLEQIRAQAPPEEFAKLQRMLLKRGLEQPLQFKKDGQPVLNIVHQAVILQAANSALAPEQKEMIEEQLDGAFAKYVQHMQDQMGFETVAELEEKLAQEGASLATLRDEMGRQQLAMSYLQERAGHKKEVSRAELLAYYEEHAEDYALPEKVKWQQIVVRVNGDREAAKAKMRDVWAALRKGDSFDDVARQYSDGATAAEGGHWDWIGRDNLADTEVEDILFELPAGSVSKLIVRDDKFELVKVTERQDAGKTPFKDVQRDIEIAMLSKGREEAVRDFLAELQEAATVATIFDNEQAASESVIENVSGSFAP